MGSFGGRIALLPAPDSTELRGFVGVGVKKTQTALSGWRLTRLAGLCLGSTPMPLALSRHVAHSFPLPFHKLFLVGAIAFPSF
jgi:hypothetical protein